MVVCARTLSGRLPVLLLLAKGRRTPLPRLVLVRLWSAESSGDEGQSVALVRRGVARCVGPPAQRVRPDSAVPARVRRASSVAADPADTRDGDALHQRARRTGSAARRTSRRTAPQGRTRWVDRGSSSPPVLRQRVASSKNPGPARSLWHRSRNGRG